MCARFTVCAATIDVGLQSVALSIGTARADTGSAKIQLTVGVLDALGADLTGWTEVAAAVHVGLRAVLHSVPTVGTALVVASIKATAALLSTIKGCTLLG